MWWSMGVGVYVSCLSLWSSRRHVISFVDVVVVEWLVSEEPGVSVISFTTLSTCSIAFRAHELSLLCRPRGCGGLRLSLGWVALLSRSQVVGGRTVGSVVVSEWCAPK